MQKNFVGVTSAAPGKVIGNYLGSMVNAVGYQFDTFPYGAWEVMNSISIMDGYGLLNAGNFADTTAGIVSVSADKSYFQQDTSNVSGNIATASLQNVNLVKPNYHPFIAYSFRLPELTDKRFLLGIGNTTSVAGYFGTDAPATAHFALQFSSARADTNWQIARDGAASGGSQTLVDTGVAAAANTGLYFIIDWTADASCTVYLLDLNFSILYSATFTTDLISPTSNATIVIGTETLTTAVKSHQLGFVKTCVRTGITI